MAGVVWLGATCTPFIQDTNENTPLNSNSPETNNSASTSNLNSSEIDTSDWLTYTNEEYGFSFRYPGEWLIKQEWLEQGLAGSKYNIQLQNQRSDTILFFLTTNDFIRKEGEGAVMYLTGPVNGNDEFTVHYLQTKGLPIYKSTSIDTKNQNIYYTLDSYGGSKVGLLAIFQNESQPFSFLTIYSTLASWSNIVDTSEIDEFLKKFESGKFENQEVTSEYLAIVGTVDF